MIERAALLCQPTTIRAVDLGSSLPEPETGSSEETPAPAELPSLNLERLAAVAIERALERTGWHQGRASELLGVSDRTLHRKIKGLGLRRPN